MMTEEPSPSYANSPHTTARKKQWARRTGVVVVALLPMSVGWAALPRWETCTSPVVPQNHLAVRFDSPADWPPPEISHAEAVFAVLDMTPQPPRGFRRWWAEHVQHQDYSHWNTAHVAVEIFARPNQVSLAQQEYDLRKSLEKRFKYHKTYTVTRFPHPAGRCLKVDVKSLTVPDMPEMISHNYFLFPRTVSEQNAEICVFCSGDAQCMPQLQDTMEQIARSIEVVKGR